MRGLQSDLTKIYEAALGAADPYASVLARVRRRGNSVDAGGQSYSLGSYRAVHVVGAGKASAEMARAVEELMGDRLQKGLLVVRDLPPRDVPSMRILQASHPEPDERGLMASRTLIHYLESEVSEDDLLIVLLSGGASALLPSPVQGISLDDKKVTTQVLLSCGATIHEINTIRKHLSRLKGGRLLNHARGTTVLALIVSDVVGDDPSTIASGPTSPDPSTFRECLDVLDRYRINTRIPETVLSYLQESARSPHGLETLKEGDPLLQRTQNCLVSTNRASLEAAAQEARARGYQPLILSASMQGSAADLARFYVSMVSEVLATGHPLPAPCCLLSGGETTVKVEGGGKGGRNQEFALWCFHETRTWQSSSEIFAALGSDGSDGPTEAAGAVVSAATRARAAKLGLDSRDYLQRNDSYHFFQQLDDLILTGPTGTNVMDFYFALVGAE